jgi:cellulose synthase/poly-beta-1,6-N-acetylglucosamine synthase-like glycosyltransferase
MAFDHLTLTIVYAATALALAALAGSGGNRLVLSATRLTARRARATPPPALDVADLSQVPLPHVLVQLPVYNEPQVCARILHAVAALDWPRDRLHVQVLDDSTDETVAIIAALVPTLRGEGLDITHLGRADRHGYKAGALAHGLRYDASPYVAIFDADFVPPPDFLLRVMPTLLARPELAFVQTRWEHLNARENALTAVQAAMLDAHFAIEQEARNRTGLFLPFNGTGGIWRRAAIDAVGGWSADTLCEDLDLALRARLCGWQAEYRDDVAVPGELPATLAGWRAQQFRWTKGFAQVARRLLMPAWRSRMPLGTKLVLTAQLCEPFCYPLTVASLLGGVVLVLSGWNDRPLQALGGGVAIAGIGSSLIFLGAGRAALQRGGWLRFPLVVAAVLLLMAGLMLSNARAVLEAQLGRASAFTRTPKRGAAGGTLIRLTPRGAGLLEIACGGATGSVLAHAIGWLSPLLSVSTVGLLVVGIGLACERWMLIGAGSRRRSAQQPIHSL